jgi:hypothetical protein
VSVARPARQWPTWIDDILSYGPVAELEDEWRAAIGDAITHVLDMRQGTRKVTCACCGATRIVPERRNSQEPA